MNGHLERAQRAPPWPRRRVFATFASSVRAVRSPRPRIRQLAPSSPLCNRSSPALAPLRPHSRRQAPSARVARKGDGLAPRTCARCDRFLATGARPRRKLTHDDGGQGDAKGESCARCALIAGRSSWWPQRASWPEVRPAGRAAAGRLYGWRKVKWGAARAPNSNFSNGGRARQASRRGILLTPRRDSGAMRLARAEHKGSRHDASHRRPPLSER